MKKVPVFLFLLFFTAQLFSQVKSVGFVAGAGYTAVDIEKAISVNDLEDWDHIGVMIKATVDYALPGGLILTGEAGGNRLYYWEYYWNDGYYSGYRYRSEWTSSLGLHIKKYFGNNLFVQAGPGIHAFNDGSGVVPGLVLASGLNIDAGTRFYVPVSLRVETVFGNATPICVLLGSGLSLRLWK